MIDKQLESGDYNLKGENKEADGRFDGCFLEAIKILTYLSRVWICLKFSFCSSHISGPKQSKSTVQYIRNHESLSLLTDRRDEWFNQQRKLPINDHFDPGMMRRRSSNRPVAPPGLAGLSCVWSLAEPGLLSRLRGGGIIVFLLMRLH